MYLLGDKASVHQIAKTRRESLPTLLLRHPGTLVGAITTASAITPTFIQTITVIKT